MIDTNQRHAAFDALDYDQFDRLCAATYARGTDRETELEDRFIVLGSGRLTLRKGELLHLGPEWVDQEAKMIHIPHHDPCDCAYCHARAEEYAEGRDMSVAEARKLTWSPKTEASARTIYYGWSGATIDAVEAFVTEVGELDMVPATVNRRVDRLAERAGIRQNVYPHALRATSAFFLADLGLEAHYLQAAMGWRDIDVAVAYLRASGVQLARRIERAFAVGGMERPDPVPREDILPPADEAVDQATGATETPGPWTMSLDQWSESGA